MTTDPSARAAVEANRRRYEELKREGQRYAPRALPGPSPRAPAPLPPKAILHREVVPGGWYWSVQLRRGEALRLALPNGPASVALVAWASADTSERLNYADTVKVQWSATVGKGRVLFSDMGRVMLSIIEDSCGAHDAIAGGSTPGSVRALSGNAPQRNTRDNFLLAAGKHGLSRRDVPPCISFFAPVVAGPDRRLSWAAERRRKDDYVDLRAEMDLLIALSNCPHPLDPDALSEPPAIEAVRFRAPPPAADDLCRTATAEAVRGFQNTDALFVSQGWSP
jgi:uncharacterized protein